MYGCGLVQVVPRHNRDAASQQADSPNSLRRNQQPSRYGNTISQERVKIKPAVAGRTYRLENGLATVAPYGPPEKGVASK